MKNLFKNWDNPISKERLELVFLNRNHAYGAYIIRKEYNASVVRAFGMTTLVLLVLAFIPSVLSCFRPVRDMEENKFDEVVLTMHQIPASGELPLPSKTKNSPYKTTRPAGQFNGYLVKDHDSTGQELSRDEWFGLHASNSPVRIDSVTAYHDLPETGLPGKPEESKVHTWVEEMPRFPGGEAAMLRFLSSNINYPAAARQDQITGTVYISFVINKEGEIENIETVRGIGGGCEEEAIRVIREMPAWKAGRQNGQAVKVHYLLPVSFQLR